MLYLGGAQVHALRELQQASLPSGSPQASQGGTGFKLSISRVSQGHPPWKHMLCHTIWPVSISLQWP